MVLIFKEVLKLRWNFVLLSELARNITLILASHRVNVIVRALPVMRRSARLGFQGSL